MPSKCLQMGDIYPQTGYSGTHVGADKSRRRSVTHCSLFSFLYCFSPSCVASADTPGVFIQIQLHDPAGTTMCVYCA